MAQPDFLDAVFSTDIELDAPDPTTDRIVDAALAEFRSFGLRKATVGDIAQRAKIGRMTLHRRFPSKQALIAAVFLQEIRSVLRQVDDVMAQHDTLVDKLVDGLAFGIRAVHTDPLFSRLLETDREAMLPYLTLDGGPLMIAASGHVAEQLRASTDAQTAGLDGNQAAATGEAIIRFCHSILLTPAGCHDLNDPGTLRTFIRPPIAALISCAT